VINPQFWYSNRADIEEAANWAATAILFNSGQDCMAGSRVYVQEEVYDEFIGTLKRFAGEVAIGLVSYRFLREGSSWLVSLKTTRLPSVPWYVSLHGKSIIELTARSPSHNRRRYWTISKSVKSKEPKSSLAAQIGQKLQTDTT
jgi:hypothetical protein